MKHPENIAIADFDYNLPEDKIALYPAKKRDESKLLIFKNNEIESSVFKNIGNFLPQDTLLIFNDTKVIQARIIIEKPSGATIEIFCLEPVDPIEIQQSFQSIGSCRWKCFIGNNKRWKDAILEKKWIHNGVEKILSLQRIQADDNAWIVDFSWDDSTLTFAQILEELGRIPLPPYIHRNTEDSDKERYQTIYALQKGSVAAPTAGLHFTEEVMLSLKNKGIQMDFVTLHVGAGTFKPVSSDIIGDHKMHEEHIIVDQHLIKNLINYCDKTIIPVGTTSMRSIESLYWFACRLMSNKSKSLEIEVDQWDPYTLNVDISPKEALQFLLKKMQKENQPFITGTTSLMIAPPYQFKFAKGIITNFHQPKSTLLLLVAALVGEKWKEIYNFALHNNFRFLSFGDSQLLLKTF